MVQQKPAPRRPAVARSVNPQAIYRNYGTYSLIGIVALLTILVVTAGFDFVGVSTQIWTLFTKGPSHVVFDNGVGIIDTVVTITGVTLMTLAVSIVTGILSSIILGNPESLAVESFEKLLDLGAWALFGGVSVEEILARWIFLGLLWPLFGGSDIAFWILFALGNIGFAIAHFGNYKKKSERSILRVIPQFVGGIAFTYLYLRYGLWITIATHFYYDVILVSSMKEQKPGIAMVVNTIYYTVAGAIALILMNVGGLSLTDLTPWFTSAQIVSLEGYTFFDYVIILLLAESVFTLVGNLLLLDPINTNKEALKTVLKASAMQTVFWLVLGTSVFFGLNWLFGLIIPNSPIGHAMGLTIALSFLSFTKSGSALARATLVDLPATFLMVAAYITLGFWPTLGIVAIFYGVNYLPKLVSAYT